MTMTNFTLQLLSIIVKIITIIFSSLEFYFSPLMIVSSFFTFLALYKLLKGKSGKSNIFNKYINLLFKSSLTLICIFIYLELDPNTIYCSDGSEDISKDKGKEKEINLGVSANVVLTTEAAKELSKGISSASSQIGLGATVGALAYSATKALKNVPLPPLQKLGIIAASGITGAGIHVSATAANKLVAEKILDNIGSSTSNTTSNIVNSIPSSPTINNNYTLPANEPTTAPSPVSSETTAPSPVSSETTAPSPVSSEINSPVDPFISSMVDLSIIELIFEDSNPFELFLAGIYLVFLGNFLILGFLANILIYKYLNSHRTSVINLLDRIIPILTKDPKSIDKIKYIILKIIEFNSKISTFWIVIFIIILIISHITSLYYLPIFIKYFSLFLKK
jgi:hypothetical protein